MGEATYITLQQNYEQVHSKLIRVVDRIESHEEYKEGMKIAFAGQFEYFNKLDVYDLGNGDFTYLGVFRTVQSASLAGILKERFGIDVEVCNVFTLPSNMSQEMYSLEPFPSEDCVKVVDGVMLVRLD